MIYIKRHSEQQEWLRHGDVSLVGMLYENRYVIQSLMVVFKMESVKFEEVIFLSLTYVLNIFYDCFILWFYGYSCTAKCFSDGLAVTGLVGQRFAAGNWFFSAISSPMLRTLWGSPLFPCWMGAHPLPTKVGGDCTALIFSPSFVAFIEHLLPASGEEWRDAGLELESQRRQGDEHEDQTGLVSIPPSSPWRLYVKVPGPKLSRLSGKESACHCQRPGLIPGLGEESLKKMVNSTPVLCLQNPMDRGVW